MSLKSTNLSSDYNNSSGGGSLGSELNHHHNSNYARKMAFLSESNVKRLDATNSDSPNKNLEEEDDNGGFRRRSSESDSIISTSINDTMLTGGTLTQTIITVPTGLKVVALVSMVS